MKKIIVLVLISFICNFSFAKKVKFAVDMTGYTVNANGVHVWGDFQVAAGFPSDWDPATIMLSQEGATNIYSIVLNIPANHAYMYQYINGLFSYEVEIIPQQSYVNPNLDYRWIYIDSTSNDTTDIGNMRFSQNAPLGYYLLRPKVNMSNETIDNNGVHAFGTILSNNNMSSTNKLYSFDAQVYEQQFYIDSTQTTATYAFANGNTIAQKETVPTACANSSNYRVYAGIEDTILQPVCYATCSICLASGINSIAKSNFNIYPNPVNTMLSWKADNTISKIQIINILGEIVFEKNISEANSISVSQFQNGFYVLKAFSKTGKIDRVTFIKN